MAGALVIYVEAQPRVPSTGATTFVRLAGGGSDMPYTFNGQTDWQAGLEDLPNVQTALQVDDEFDFGSSAVPQALQLKWRPTSKARLATAANLYWKDAAISVWLGVEGSTPAQLIPAGKVLDATVDDDALTITLSDPAAAFALPVLVDRFGGTGDEDGPTEWKGRIKRRAWGRCYNVEALAILPASNIYCLTDPGRPLQGIDAVRDGGRAADPATLTVLPWQGSIAATFDALKVAAAAPGSGVLCPTIGCLKWWTTPQSTLTVDLRGEVGSGYVETAAAIAERIVQARSGPAFASGEVAASAAAKAYPCGVLIDDENTTVGNAMATLLGGTGQLFVIDSNGQLRLRRWVWGSSVASFRSEHAARRRVFKPVKTRKLGYHKNFKVMGRGDIVAAVLNETTGIDARLSRDNVTVPADSSGNLAAGVLDAAGGTFTLKLGNEDVSAGASFSVLAGAVGGTATIDAAGAYKPTSMTAPTLVVTFRANYGGVDFDRVYTLTKAPAGSGGGSGSPGAPAKLLFIVNDRDQITYDGTGAINPSSQPVTFTLDKQNLSSSTVTVALYTASNPPTQINANSYLTGSGTITPAGNTFTMTGVTITLSAANFDSARSGTEGIILSVTHADGVGDKADILRAPAGAPGAAGSPGANAKTIYVRSSTQQITYDSTGAINPSGQSIKFTAVKQNTANTVTWRVFRQDEVEVTASSYLDATSGDVVNMSAAAFDSARGSTKGVIVRGYVLADGIADEISVTQQAAGANGAAGSPGQTGNTVKRVYKRSASAPATPSGNYVPSGWSGTLPAADGNPAWASDAEIGNDGTTLVGAWTTPALFEAAIVGGGSTTGYSRNGTATLVLAPGQTVSVAWNYNVNWTSGSGNVQGKVVVGGAGSGNIAVGSVLTLSSSDPNEQDGVTTTYTNTTGSTGSFTFTYQVSFTGSAAGNFVAAETWMTVG